jgi:uncharacterized protein (TIGR02996 family)
MDLLAAFLDDIVAHPGDSTPWLVLADWLTERDDPRGEMVRLLRLCWDEPDHDDFATRHAALEAHYASGVRLPLPRFTNSLGMEFVWVPPGRFWVGGYGGKHSRKRPTRMDEPFWIGIHTVTQGQWRTLLSSNPSAFSRAGSRAEAVRDIPDADLDRFPVEMVTWSEAEQFIATLNDRESGTGGGYRLPTDIEWEYAVRSPVTCREDCGASFYFAQPCEDLTLELANYNGHNGNRRLEGALQRPAQVGSYPPNRLGIHDLHGNVMEWIATTVDSTRRRLRGGHWDCSEAWCKASFRDAISPDARRDDLGFRLVRAAPVS